MSDHDPPENMRTIIIVIKLVIAKLYNLLLPICRTYSTLKEIIISYRGLCCIAILPVKSVTAI